VEISIKSISIRFSDMNLGMAKALKTIYTNFPTLPILPFSSIFGSKKNYIYNCNLWEILVGEFILFSITSVMVKIKFRMKKVL